MDEIRSKYIGGRALRRQPVSREEYTLSSLERTFPTGQWVEAISQIAPQENYEQPLYLTVIGGQKYDQDALSSYLGTLPDHTIAIMGEGRGAELNCERIFGEFANLIPVNPDLYGKAARKVNVEQVLSFAPTSPLLLVGTGERVKQAKQWLKRARWGREVVEIP